MASVWQDICRDRNVGLVHDVLKHAVSRLRRTDEMTEPERNALRVSLEVAANTMPAIDNHILELYTTLRQKGAAKLPVDFQI